MSTWSDTYELSCNPIKNKISPEDKWIFGLFDPPLLSLSMATLLVELLPFVSSPSGNITKKLWIPRSDFYFYFF